MKQTIAPKTLFSNKYVAGTLVILSFIYLLVGLNVGLSVYDEGLSVYGAMRVLAGDIPYKDFRGGIYPPGQFYLLAGLFKIFGYSIIVERIFSTVIIFLITVIIYVIAQKIVSERSAQMAWILSIVWLGWGGYYASPMITSILCCLLSCYSIVKYLSQTRKVWLVLAGFAAGIGMVFRHDLGLYAFLSESLVVVLFLYLIKGRQDKTPLNKLLLSIISNLVLLVIGLSTALLPIAIFFVIEVPLDHLIHDLIVFPLTTYPRVRSLPYPGFIPQPSQIDPAHGFLYSYIKVGFASIPFYFPLAIYLTVLVYSVHRIHHCKWYGEQDLIKLSSGALLWLLGVFGFNNVMVRSDIVHLLPTFIPGIILFVFLLEEYNFMRKQRVERRRPFILVPILFVSVIALPTFLNPLLRESKLIRDVYLRSLYSLELDRTNGIYLDSSEIAYGEAIHYVQQVVPVGERIFVGNFRHDRIFINDMMFYFLSNRHSATVYHDLHPGLATTRAVQEAIISDLECYNVRYIVLVDFSKWENEPNESSKTSGVFILDEYIHSRFVPTQSFGKYVILKRTNL